MRANFHEKSKQVVYKQETITEHVPSIMLQIVHLLYAQPVSKGDDKDDM